MRFGDYETLRKYEKFKEEVFGKKNKQSKKQSKHSTAKKTLFKHNNLISFIHHHFFKRLVLTTLLGTSIYYLHQKGVFTYFRDIIIEKNPQIFNPIISHTLIALRNDLERRFVKAETDAEKSVHFASNELASLIEEDYLVIKKKVRGRVIRKESRSEFGIGELRFGVKE